MTDKQSVKHTPGKWMPAMMTTRLMNVVPHRLHGFIVSIVGGDGSGIVAHAHGPTEKECEANARVIAAAPDAIAALKRLEDSGLLQSLLDMDAAAHEEGEEEIAGPAVRAARAAVARVTEGVR